MAVIARKNATKTLTRRRILLYDVVMSYRLSVNIFLRIHFISTGYLKVFIDTSIQNPPLLSGDKGDDGFSIFFVDEMEAHSVKVIISFFPTEYDLAAAE
jgi:hypothetical protein